MAPLPASNTPRFRVFYTNAGKQHTLNIRSHDSPAALGVNVSDLFNVLSPLLNPTTVNTVEFAASGSNIFNLVTTGIEGMAVGGGSPPPVAPSIYTNFIGRSSDGRRVRLAFFGLVSVAVDFRWLPTENAQIDAAIALLNLASNHFVSIGDIKPVWKAYANAGYNAYWQKEIRP